LEQIVLRELTGETSISCALESAIGCSSGAGPFVCGASTPACGCSRFGAWLSDTLGVASASLGEQICQLGLEAGEQELVTSLSRLSSDGSSDTFVLADIVGLLSDADFDLKTDRIDAANAGTFVIDGDAARFTASMFGTGERQTCTNNASCGAGETCQPQVAVLNDCDGRLVCAPRVGTGTSDEGCITGADCGSGSCLGTRCFEACAADNECPGALRCSDVAVDLIVDNSVEFAVTACGM
ncbi:MAG: hypothetical protein AAF658_19340, partial [Myxococcota bacterium]